MSDREYVERMVIFGAGQKTKASLSSCEVEKQNGRPVLVVCGRIYDFDGDVAFGRGAPRIAGEEWAETIRTIDDAIRELYARRAAILDVAWANGSPVRRCDVEGT